MNLQSAVSDPKGVNTYPELVQLPAGSHRPPVLLWSGWLSGGFSRQFLQGPRRWCRALQHVGLPGPPLAFLSLVQNAASSASGSLAKDQVMACACLSPSMGRSYISHSSVPGFPGPRVAHRSHPFSLRSFPRCPCPAVPLLFLCCPEALISLQRSPRTPPPPALPGQCLLQTFS